MYRCGRTENVFLLIHGKHVSVGRVCYACLICYNIIPILYFSTIIGHTHPMQNNVRFQSCTSVIPLGTNLLMMVDLYTVEVSQ